MFMNIDIAEQEDALSKMSPVFVGERSRDSKLPLFNTQEPSFLGKQSINIQQIQSISTGDCHYFTVTVFLNQLLFVIIQNA